MAATADVPNDGKLVDVLLPGFIVADSQVQFGEPCLIDTRLPWYVGQGWVWEYLDDPERAHEGLTREHIIALAARETGRAEAIEGEIVKPQDVQASTRPAPAPPTPAPSPPEPQGNACEHKDSYYNEQTTMLTCRTCNVVLEEPPADAPKQRAMV